METNKIQVQNILLVDDDNDDREFFITVVEEISPGIHVNVAGSRKELFENLDQKTPDIIFIDSCIQNESGHTSIKEIRDNQSFAQLPIVMYTGSSDYKNIQKAFEAGASSYIVKPNTLSEIKRVLQTILLKDWSQGFPIQQKYYSDQKFQNFNG